MSNQKGRGGMGSRKHGKSGVAPKSPRLRHQMKLEAERNERKASKSTCKYSSVAEALREDKQSS